MAAVDSATPAALPGLPRLLKGMPPDGVMSLEEHVSVHGEPVDWPGSGLAELIALVQASGLRGRGGASFPAGVKLEAVAAGRRSPVVVVNAVEGEPVSAKDRLLVSRMPHLVLEGALIVAQALGASEVVFCVADGSAGLDRTVRRALEERATSRRVPCPVRVVAVPDVYLAGEETALVNHLNGGPIKPTFHPPRPSDRGVDRRPTLVHNPETLAHLGLIARHGPDWFRQLGTDDDPGSTLVTVRGAVVRPGVYEIERGTAAAVLLEAAGGTSEEVRALLVGGYFGSWLDGSALSGLTLANDHLAAYGAALGSGVIVALPASACPVAEVARVVGYLNRESAQQCGPCINGLHDIAWTVDALARGAAHATANDDLARWMALIPGRGACHHPEGAVRFIASALNVFAEEFADHAEHGACDDCARPAVLRAPPPKTQRRSAAASPAGSAARRRAVVDRPRTARR
jgi:NADH:ubiquinone oxidoreductase subunit F (NADH-binding)